MADQSIHGAIAQAVPVVIGGFLAMGGGVLKAWIDFFLEQRKQRAAEDRAIHAEQREEARREEERTQAEAAQLKKDEDVLLMYKTQLRGATDIAQNPSVSDMGMFRHLSTSVESPTIQKRRLQAVQASPTVL